MAVKYNIEYFDTENNKHTVNIDDPNYSGSVINVNGYAELFYAEISEILQVQRGVGLRVYLDADETLTFNDLYSEKDKTFAVTYSNHKGTQFRGWIDSENWFEDFVNDKWVVSFDCIDGLGYLEDLSYVQDTGLPYIGKERQSFIIANALKRTGFDLPIYTDIQIYYTGLSTVGVSVLYNVYANQNRYIKDDGETIMSCREVINDVLEPYGAILVQYDDKWVICKPNQIYDSGTLSFITHNSSGFPTGSATLEIDYTISKYDATLDKDEPHYCNGNQSIRNNKSFGAYRINYKYGLVNSLFDNTKLYSDDGTTLDDWIITSPSDITLQNPGYGAQFSSTGTTTDVVILETETFAFLEGISAQILLQYDNLNELLVMQFYGWFKLRIVLDATGQTYYLNDNGEWVTTVTTIQQGVSGALGATYAVNTQPMPEDGDIQVQILKPQTVNQSFTLELTTGSIAINSEDSGSLIKEGETHTFQRISQPSVKIPDNKEVFTGDDASDVYVGTLFKNNEVDPTETWFRLGVTEAKPILRIMGEEAMIVNQSVSRVLSGGVYNFFPYLSRITLEGLDGVFMVTKYNYNTKTNVIEAEFKQIFGGDIESDLFYELTFDYGNVVEPTIKG